MAERRDDTATASETIRRGLACGRWGELEGGVLRLLDGLAALDARHEPRLALSAGHNLALFLVELELPVLARSAVLGIKPLYRSHGDPLMRARLAWIEGSIARLDGQTQRATRKLGRALEAFRALGAISLAAQVRDELATLSGGDEGQPDGGRPATGTPPDARAPAGKPRLRQDRSAASSGDPMG